MKGDEERGRFRRCGDWGREELGDVEARKTHTQRNLTIVPKKRRETRDDIVWWVYAGKWRSLFSGDDSDYP